MTAGVNLPNVVTPISKDTAFGSIVINADGTYTYTLDNDNSKVNALNLYHVKVGLPKICYQTLMSIP
ncbi:VCBS domain-containing protein [Psychrobacter sanguinis]|uniref:VCBS domain-containing protein n=1 Tax=Psychrobacter sanguinis TaxID=861445 RepID=UPI0028A27933|nr:VCBS domain-containing protein [Psychrobacter sanguinis]